MTYDNIKVTKNQDTSFEKPQRGGAAVLGLILALILLLLILLLLQMLLLLFITTIIIIISITCVIIIIIVSIIITFINVNSFTTFSKQVFLKKEPENPIICFSMDYNGNKYQQFSKLYKA